MPVARPEGSDARVIAHIDMDCFYVQVEQRKQPELKGLPTAVVQYNSWKGGGLIAVGYEARKFGVKRSMRGDEAKKACPEIHLVQVPVARGKADLNIYRNAGSEVVSILSQRGRCERASIDEVYLDLTDAAEAMLAENPPQNLEVINKEVLESHVLGLNENENEKGENTREWFCRSDADHRDKLLACGAIIVAELRMQVLKETEFTCSAGIAHNKMLAKLSSAMNKPSQQTVVPFSAVKELLASLPVKKMKQLGGKLGDSLQSDLGVNTVGDLLQFSEEHLQDRYGVNTGTWLWNIARGISGDEVEGRLLPKSHGSGKTFPGPQALKTISSVECWLKDLCEELSERIQSDLDQNKRIAHTLTLHARAHMTGDLDSPKKFPSKSCPLRYGTAKIQQDALKLFNSGLRDFLSLHRVETKANQMNLWRVTGLSVSASKILSTPDGTRSILTFFHDRDPSCSLATNNSNETIQGTLPSLLSGHESCSESDTSEQPKGSTEATEISCNESNVDRQKQCINKWNNKERSSILKFFPSHDPTSSPSKLTCDGVIQDAMPLSGSDLDPSQAKAHKEIGINSVKPEHGRAEQKTGISNQKGQNSILTFLRAHNPSYSSLEKESKKITQDTAPSSTTLFSGSSQAGVQDRIDCCGSSSNSNGQRRGPWEFSVEDIDPSVIDELPPEIQDEVRGWLRPPKRANTAKRGSNIANYFLPAKKT